MAGVALTTESVVEASVLGPRLRLASLWLSQVGRNLADNCLRIFVMFELARASVAQRDAAWLLCGVFLMLPAIVFCPVNGAISNSLPKRGVLVGSSALCLLAIVLFGVMDGPWLACWAVVAAASVLYGLTRYALLPASAQDTHMPLTRVNGWIEMGAASAIVAGPLVGGFTYGQSWPAVVGWLGVAPAWAAPLEALGWPLPLALAAGFSLICLLAALPADFPSDVRRPASPRQALVDFFRDARRIVAFAPSRESLIGMAVFRGLVTLLANAVLAVTLSRLRVEEGEVFAELVRVGMWVLIGAVAGSLLAGLQGHPSRSLGLVPLGGMGLLLAVVSAARTTDMLPAALYFLLGLLAALINVPLAARYQDSLPADARGNGMAVRAFADYLSMLLMAGLVVPLALFEIISAEGQLWLVAVLVLAALVPAVIRWGRELLEQVLEFLIWPMYRIRAHGPGKDSVPHYGPLLVIANHTAYFDPIWLAKVMPRRLTPMMTSLYYDLPVLRFFMARVFHVIRVEWSTFRREAPELESAIAALDRGECVLLFPEGWVRRTAEVTLRKFGQGVVRILQQRPQTPVVFCWIEGGWGTFTSYYLGPPGRNKPLDFRRRIDIAIESPQILDAAVLADQRAARQHFLQACLDCRRYLGLEPGKIAETEVSLAADNHVDGPNM
jgi:1-acyl-sn-glycerol-3-phosphate acyltransferase